MNDTTIRHCVLHKIGNRLREEGVHYSEDCLDNVAAIQDTLIDYFLSPFHMEDTYRFVHDRDLSLHEVHGCVSEIFDNPTALYDCSRRLAKLLYMQSNHPKIKSGEFYTVYFADCLLDGRRTDAIGLFKSENKDTFLKVSHRNGTYNLTSDEGINIKKLDKGCLVFNVAREDGYVVAVVDNINRATEAQYWVRDFLHVRPRQDEYSNTERLMAIAKNFVTEELPRQQPIGKKEQIDLLNRSLDYFKDHDHFDLDSFATQVMGSEERMAQFRQYRDDCSRSGDMDTDDRFSISDAARRKSSRSYKRAIVLDKKIRITVDGHSDRIEQGRDERGTFYKIYFDHEE